MRAMHVSLFVVLSGCFVGSHPAPARERTVIVEDCPPGYFWDGHKCKETEQSKEQRKQEKHEQKEEMKAEKEQRKEDEKARKEDEKEQKKEDKERKKEEKEAEKANKHP